MKIYFLGFFILAFANVKTFSQCEDYSNFPKGKAAALQLFEQYQNSMKIGDYEAAFEFWQSLYEYAPAGNEQHYLDGIEIYKKLMRKATDATTVVNYQSELLRLYDRRMKCFGYPSETENIILGEKAIEMYHINYDESVTIRTFQYVLETDELRHSPEFVEVYGTFSNYLYGGEKIDLFHLWQSQQQLNKIIDYNIENSADSLKSAYEKAAETINIYYDIYLNIDDDCAGIADSFRLMYLNSTTEKGKNLAYESLQNLNCPTAFFILDSLKSSYAILTESEIGSELKAIETASDSASNTAKKATLAYQRNQYLLAIELYEQCLEESGNNAYKARYAYRIAEIYLNKFNDKIKAKSFAEQAFNFDFSWGRPFYLIGNMYEASYNECVEKAKVESKLIVLAAIEKWTFAKEIDINMSALANAKLANYESLMGDNLDCENKVIKTIQVDCWIDEKVEIQVCE